MAEKKAAEDNKAAGRDGPQFNPTTATVTQPEHSHNPAEGTQLHKGTVQSTMTETPLNSDKCSRETHFAQDEQEEVKLLHLEATAAIREISFAVRHAYKSTRLTSTDQTIYINVQTKEECTLCLELSLQGFRVVGRKFDEVDRSCYSRHYETIYALLDDLSLEYRRSFGETLQSRLEALAIEQQTEETQTLEGE